jgi:hypothetical protein
MHYRKELQVDLTERLLIGREMLAPAVLDMATAEHGEHLLTAFADNFSRRPRFNKLAPNVSESLDRGTQAIRDYSKISFFDPNSLVSNAKILVQP